MTKPRGRDLGLPFPGKTGPYNAITDVPGVLVGFTTLTDPGKNMRTGVTAIIPRAERDTPRP
ncbi:S58 family peptidase, partial [Mesorhizobium sp. M4A.F.Ca.ET.029.04.2.1]